MVIKRGKKCVAISPYKKQSQPLLSVPVSPARQLLRTILPRSPLWLCLLLALIVRIWLVIHTHGFMDADEALVGIQAQHILHGERPLYYYGQPYMGSLEAYLIAGVFAILGSSPWTLRIIPIILSLVLVSLSWHIATNLATVAKLPPSARRWFTTSVGLFTALPPLYDGVIELRIWGGHIEIYILMLSLLYATLRLIQRWYAASRKEIVVRWSGIGFLIGLGLWIYPLIASAILAAALWIIGFILYVAFRSLYSYKKRSCTGELESFKYKFLARRRAEGAGRRNPPCQGTRGSFKYKFFAGKVQGTCGSLPGAWRSFKYKFFAGRVQGTCGSLPGARRCPPKTLFSFFCAPRSGAQEAKAKNPLLLALIVIPASLLGFTPGLYWGAQHHWANVLYLLSPGSDGGNSPAVMHHYPNRLALFADTARLYDRCLVPEIFGGSLPSQSLTSSSVLSFWLVTAVMVTCMLATIVLVLVSLRLPHPLLLTIRTLVALPLLFGLSTILVFFFSHVVGGSLQAPCTRDGVGRYAAPLLLTLPFFVATLCTAVILILSKQRIRIFRLSSLSPRIFSSSHYFRFTQRFSFIPTRFFLRLRAHLSLRWSHHLLAALIVIYLGTVGNTYASSDQHFVFQSFTCLWAPFDNQPIIAYLTREHISFAWSTTTLGNTIMFKTNGTIHIADPTVFSGGLNRLPENALLVKNAARASLLDMVPHSQPYPDTLKYLDQLHISYRLARIPTQPGNIDILIITPLNHTLQPSEARPHGADKLRC